ncbi:hypothetical protein RIdsm_03595 [Roseovarius indicus]|uniref:Uncharacterized protein n=1 Tax=Roseovarius indicus TaxID=540747 RepID=A0A5P3AHP3_9RHOB|nr:hypothetical protein RIdsm_03595 [Roseovarius indicus]
MATLWPTEAFSSTHLVRGLPERAAPFLVLKPFHEAPARNPGRSPPRIAGPSRRTGGAPPFTARLWRDGTAIWQPECHARLLEARLRHEVAATPVGSPHHGPTMRGSSTAEKNSRFAPRNRPSPRTRRSSAVSPSARSVRCAASGPMGGLPTFAARRSSGRDAQVATLQVPLGRRCGNSALFFVLWPASYCNC